MMPAVKTFRCSERFSLCVDAYAKLLGVSAGDVIRRAVRQLLLDHDVIWKERLDGQEPIPGDNFTNRVRRESA